MLPLKLKKTKLKAFRSFLEEQQTPEYPKTGLYLVDGKNLDTGGSSNSGKTSLLMSIGYALNYNVPPASQLQNWNTKSKMVVEQVFASDLGDVTITRTNIGTVLKIGQESYHTANLVQEKLKEIIGIDTEILEALTYRKQKMGSYFLGLSDQNKKEFLTKLLGLDAIEKLIDESDLKLAVLQKKFDDSVIRVQVYKKSWEAKALPKKPEKASTKDLEVRMEQLHLSKKVLSHQLKGAETRKGEATAKLNEAIQTSAAAFDAQNIKLNEKLAALIGTKEEFEARESPEKLKQDIQFLETDLIIKTKDFNSKLQSKKDELSSVKAAYYSANNRIDTQIVNLTEQIARSEAALEANICDSCARPLDSALDLQSKILQLIANKMALQTEKDMLDFGNIQALEAELASLMELRDSTLNVLKAKLMESKANYGRFESNKQKEIKLMDMEIDACKANINSLKIQRTLAINKLESESGLQTIKDQILQIKSQANLIDQQYANCESEIENINKIYKLEMAQYKALVDEKEVIKQEMVKEKLDMEKLEKEAKLERDFMQMLGKEGFLGNIFDEVLNEISVEVSDMLKNIPNVARVTFKLKSEKEVKSKGTFKKAITPVVYKSGVEIPLHNGLSGGMLSVVELAIDLAVTNVVSRRTGFKPGFMLLDEAMDGLGPVEKDALLTLLRDNCYDRLVLVVDHDPATKELMDGALVISSKNEESMLANEFI